MATKSLTKNLCVRLSEADDQALARYAARCGETNRTRIVRKLICELGGSGPYLLGTDLDALREVSREVRSVGINLNQLVRAINSGHVRLPSTDDAQVLHVLTRAVETLRQELNAIILRSRNREA